jgi:hypothetical protein
MFDTIKFVAVPDRLYPIYTPSAESPTARDVGATIFDTPFREKFTLDPS